MIINTNHFKSFGAAVRYYKAYGFGRDAVQQKLKRGEIKIGPPVPKSGRVTLTDEQRYTIELGAN